MTARTDFSAPREQLVAIQQIVKRYPSIRFVGSTRDWNEWERVRVSFETDNMHEFNAANREIQDLLYPVEPPKPERKLLGRIMAKFGF